MSQERAMQGQSRNKLNDVSGLDLNPIKEIGSEIHSKRLFDTPSELIKVQNTQNISQRSPILVMGNGRDVAKSKGLSSNAVRTNIKLIDDFKSIQSKEPSLSPNISKLDPSESGTDEGTTIQKDIADDDSDFSLESKDLSYLKSYQKKFRVTKRLSTE